MTRYWLFGMPLLLLSACATHEFRLEPGGDAAADKPNETAAIAAGTPIIVAAGNILLGPAAALARSPASLSASASSTLSGDQTAIVSGILLSSGQTIIQLDSGSSLLIGGTGATIGDAVTLSTSGMVTSGPVGLIGATIQAANPVFVAPTIATGTPLATPLSGVAAIGPAGPVSLPPVTGGTLPPIGSVLDVGCC